MNGELRVPGCMQLSADTTGINSSHIIHRVAFGPVFPGQVNPLDGMQPCWSCLKQMHQGGDADIVRVCTGFERLLKTESGTFKYYLKLVPTEYVKLDGTRSFPRSHVLAATLFICHLRLANAACRLQGEDQPVLCDRV